MSWSSRRNGIPRITRTIPTPPLVDVTDEEYDAMVDDELEREYAALHEPHDDDRLPRRRPWLLGLSDSRKEG